MDNIFSVNLGNLLLSLSYLADISNPIISYHQFRTAFLAKEIALHSSLNSEMVERVYAAALIHDIGALSIEEKTELHNIKDIDVDSTYKDYHCIRGEFLLKQLDWYRNLSRPIRFHHTNYAEFESKDENPSDVYCAQIILLADYVERLIDRSKLILYQIDDIKENIRNLDDSCVSKEIIYSFMQASERESFWLDLMSYKLFTTISQNPPYKEKFIGMNSVLDISEVFKQVIDFKSPFTATHSTGVASCAEYLAKVIGVNEVETSYIKLAGNLHDIGKLTIPNSIIEKPFKLTKNEYNIIKSHTYYTYLVLNDICNLHDIAKWASFHHEKLNGSGYPFHVDEAEIDLNSRIVAVADVFTALIEDRPYRNGMKKAETIDVLKGEVKDKKLDRVISEALLDNYEQVDQIVKMDQLNAKQKYRRIFSQNVGRSFYKNA